MLSEENIHTVPRALYNSSDTKCREQAGLHRDEVDSGLRKAWGNGCRVSSGEWGVGNEMFRNCLCRRWYNSGRVRKAMNGVRCMVCESDFSKAD